METTKELLKKELERLKTDGIKIEDLNANKNRILLDRARAFESNDSIAAYYVKKRHELRMNGKLTNHVAAIARLTPEDLQRVANKYLRDDSRVIVRSTPTLTFTQFYIGLGLSIVGVPGTGFYLLRRFVKRRRRHARDLLDAKDSDRRDATIQVLQP